MTGISDHLVASRMQGSPDGPRMQPVKSGNLRAVGYDVATQALHIEFPSGVYVFAGVPGHHHAALVTAESPGGYFAQHIRPQFKGEKR